MRRLKDSLLLFRLGAVVVGLLCDEAFDSFKFWSVIECGQGIEGAAKWRILVWSASVTRLLLIEHNLFLHQLRLFLLLCHDFAVKFAHRSILAAKDLDLCSLVELWQFKDALHAYKFTQKEAVFLHTLRLPLLHLLEGFFAIPVLFRQSCVQVLQLVAAPLHNIEWLFDVFELDTLRCCHIENLS